MRTIGRHWPTKRPDGDFVAMCGYCGVHWRFSQMWRDRSGNLVCPDEGPGRSALALSEANARAARRAKVAREARRRGAYGGYDGGILGVAVHRTESLEADDPAPPETDLGYEGTAYIQEDGFLYTDPSGSIYVR